ncbi:unnamed protein product, partial [Sphacelaria rigidula]
RGIKDWGPEDWGEEAPTMAMLTAPGARRPPSGEGGGEGRGEDERKGGGKTWRGGPIWQAVFGGN